MSAAARIAIVHGSPAFLAALTPMLPRDLQPRPVSEKDDLGAALSDHAACLVVVECGLLPGAVASMRLTTDSPPVLAMGCPDAASVAAALAAGAALALREDAGVAETEAAMRALARDHESHREAAFLRLDLENQRALLMKDDLTAAGNRRFFDVFVADAVESARADGGAVSLIFMDIDNLKAVNVKHGHSMGSLVLREAAARLIRGLGPRDRVMRYGGDEFCVVLPGRDARAAVAIAESLRNELASRPFATEATGGVLLTASFGIAEFPEHADDAMGLVRAADAAMLAIKDQKNGIQVAASA